MSNAYNIERMALKNVRVMIEKLALPYFRLDTQVYIKKFDNVKN
jgi:hypothetical protein